VFFTKFVKSCLYGNTQKTNLTDEQRLRALEERVHNTLLYVPLLSNIGSIKNPRAYMIKEREQEITFYYSKESLKEKHPNCKFCYEVAFRPEEMHDFKKNGDIYTAFTRIDKEAVRAIVEMNEKNASKFTRHENDFYNEDETHQNVMRFE